eukprot:TRINITY_DN3751_c0_g1_i1.p1 TRINITY_DN3751_c0_g1~~TRINITY_DN3751_c0_g1_i1.p1  ORF type:complete len:200 (-),score=13.50 TRINITY_DN3751_c0_g1_i1:13-612(-)
MPCTADAGIFCALLVGINSVKFIRSDGITQDDAEREELLRVIQNGLKFGGSFNVRVCVIGAGMAGLAAADVLIRSGYHVTIIEASHYMGGRAKTIYSKFSGPLHSQGGAMRFPPSQSHKYIQLFNLTLQEFITGTHNGLIFLQGYWISLHEKNAYQVNYGMPRIGGGHYVSMRRHSFFEIESRIFFLNWKHVFAVAWLD